MINKSSCANFKCLLLFLEVEGRVNSFNYIIFFTYNSSFWHGEDQPEGKQCFMTDTLRPGSPFAVTFQGYIFLSYFSTTHPPTLIPQTSIHFLHHCLHPQIAHYSPLYTKMLLLDHSRHTNKDIHFIISLTHPTICMRHSSHFQSIEPGVTLSRVSDVMPVTSRALQQPEYYQLKLEILYMCFKKLLIKKETPTCS